jgi:hypothetical protein
MGPIVALTDARLLAKLVALYRKVQKRHAHVQQSMAKVGVDAFLSGHEGWYFHPGLRTDKDKRD